MNKKLFILLLLFFSIVPNLGFFNYASLLIIVFILINLLIFKDKNRVIFKQSSTLGLLILPIYGLIYYGGLYQNQGSILIGKYIIFFLLIIVSLFNLIPVKSNYDHYLFKGIIVFYLIISFLTIYNSPHPHVDTVVVLKEAPLKLIQGKNPYSEEYSRVYPGIESNYYNYLPASFLYSLPFVLLFNDPRFGIICANLVSIFLLRKLFKNKINPYSLNILTLVFLFLPRSFYILEHSYLDPIIFLFFICFLYFYLNKKIGWAILFLGFFFSFRQTLIILLPILLQGIKKLQEIITLKKLILFFFPFMIVFLFFIFNPKAFLEDVFFNLNPNKITSPIYNSLTLPSLLNKTIFVSNNQYGYLTGYLFFLLLYLFVYLQKRHILIKLSTVLLLFNIFMYHAFFNSYYLVCLFLFTDYLFNFSRRFKNFGA